MTIIGQCACGFKGCRYCDPSEYFTSTVYQDAKAGLELERLRLRVAHLEAENERLRLLVEFAYKEGFQDGDQCPSAFVADLHEPHLSWQDSEARKALKGEEAPSC